MRIRSPTQWLEAVKEPEVEPPVEEIMVAVFFHLVLILTTCR